MRLNDSAFDKNYYGAYLGGAWHWAKDRGRSDDNPIWEDAELLAKTKPTRVLDLGCGRGELLAMLATLMLDDGREFRGYGYDPYEASLPFRRLTWEEFGVDGYCQDMNNTHLLPQKLDGVPGFDLVIVRNVFQCLDPNAQPREIDLAAIKMARLAKGRLRAGGDGPPPKIFIKEPWEVPLVSEDLYHMVSDAWANMGVARLMTPWRDCDQAGRLFWEYVVEGDDARNHLSIGVVYDALTRTRQIEAPAEFAAKLFPKMEARYDEASGWLAVW